jgi:hypothetical protein
MSVEGSDEVCGFLNQGERAKITLAKDEPAYIISDADEPWAVANKTCNEWGGRLATIHSEEE